MNKKNSVNPYSFVSVTLSVFSSLKYSKMKLLSNIPNRLKYTCQNCLICRFNRFPKLDLPQIIRMYSSKQIAFQTIASAMSKKCLLYIITERWFCFGGQSKNSWFGYYWQKKRKGEGRNFCWHRIIAHAGIELLLRFWESEWGVTHGRCLIDCLTGKDFRFTLR